MGSNTAAQAAATSKGYRHPTSTAIGLEEHRHDQGLDTAGLELSSGPGTAFEVRADVRESMTLHGLSTSYDDTMGGK